jgi:hypothetical protein
MIDPCSCYLAGFCDRHQREKTAKEIRLCRRDWQYREHYDNLHFRYSKLELEYFEEYKCDDLDTSRVSIAVLGHCEQQFVDIKERNYLNRVFLQDLDLGNSSKFQRNESAEARAFLCPTLFDTSYEYVGVVTASWNYKYSGKNKIDEFHKWPSAHALINSGRDDIILCANTYDFDSISALSNILRYKDIDRILSYLSQVSQKQIGKRGILSNQIICHRSIYENLCDFLRPHLEFIYDYCEDNKWDCSALKSTNNRIIGFFCEQLTCLWSISQNYTIIENEKTRQDWYSDHRVLNREKRIYV